MIKLTQKSSVLQVCTCHGGFVLNGIEDGIGRNEGRRPDFVEQVGELHEGQAHQSQGTLGVLLGVALHPPAERLENLHFRRAKRVPGY